jgi:ribosome-associated protein
MNLPDEDAPDADDAPLPPSKSSRKRDAHSLQKLGEQLIAMREAAFLTLPLPEALVDAIREARRLKSRPALARQRQYIGKLMRDVDIEPLEAALAALTDRQNAHARLRR